MVEGSSRVLGQEIGASAHELSTSTKQLETGDDTIHIQVEQNDEDEDEDKSSKFNKVLTALRKYGTFIGPGLLISVAYMDPGNYATGITAGAANQYSLLFIVFLSDIIAIFLQSLCIKLGSVTGYDLARCCREYFPKWLNIILWILAECAIIATDVAEVIGSAIALNILLRIPLPAGVCITIVDVILVLIAYRNDTSSTKLVKYFEYSVGLLVFAVVVCFAVELSQIHADVREVFRGFVPSKEMFEGSGMTIATSLIGSTVMIHSLFLGSGIVQPRLREYDVMHGYVNLDEICEANDEKDPRSKKDREAEYFYTQYKPSYQSIKYSYKYSIIELTVTLLTFALFVNAAILIVAGSSLYNTPEALNADLYTIHYLLSKNLAPVVGTIFMLALLFSGQSAGIVCTIAGQIVSEGHINWKVKPWLRRLITRAISILPCLAISVSIGRNGLSIALNISQVIISLLLPPLTAPLIYFTCKKEIMRVALTDDDPDYESDSIVSRADDQTDEEQQENSVRYKYMANNWITASVAIAIWLFISALNVYAIYDMAINGVASS
ncbi:manganese transporter [Scheffersomyces amazonensis]|uniref:manganese transporter n=1 Tax=Scheffersomyces amazonensis TaxID=1078765 RepID=UPI00315C8D8E